MEMVRKTPHAKLIPAKLSSLTLSPSKRPLDSLENVTDDPRNFPSLASLFGDNELLSNDEEDESSLEQSTLNLSKLAKNNEELSLLQINLSGKKNNCENLPLKFQADFGKVKRYITSVTNNRKKRS